MTEIALHGFDVITGADAVHGVGMAKIVYPCVGKADAFHDTLEAVEDRTVGDLSLIHILSRIFAPPETEAFSGARASWS